jgi:hypothetical protein
MINFDRVKKLIGIRKTNDIVTPRILRLEEFQTPKASLWIFADVKNYVPKKEWYFAKYGNRITTFIPDKLNSTLGSPVIKHKNVKTFLKNEIQESDEFRFTTKIDKLETESFLRPVVITLGHLDGMYKYPKRVEAEYHNYKNIIATAIDNIVGVDRAVCFDIPIPRTIADIQTYKKAMKSDRFAARELNSFVLLEFLKLISTKYHKDSIWYKGIAKNIYFMFRTRDGVTMINIKDIACFNKEHKDTYESIVRGYTEISAFKRFLFYIVTILRSEPASMEFIEADIKLDVKSGFASTGKEDISEDEIDSILANFTPIEEDVSEESVRVIPETTTEIMDKQISEYKDVINVTDKTVTDLKEIHASNNKRLKELEISPSEYLIDENEMTLLDSVSVLDKEILKDPIAARDKKYLSDINDKHLEKSILSLERVGIGINNISKTETTDITGTFETLEIDMKLPDGKSKKIKLFLHGIDKDGRMKINGNNYIMRKQQTDRPIRKINKDTVSLSSYYGKLMVTRGETKAVNLGAGIFRELKKLAADKKVRLLVQGDIKIRNIELPILYTRIASSVRSFKFKNMFFMFDYHTRDSIVEDLSIEKGGYVIAGKDGKTPLLIKYNNVYRYEDGKYIDMGNFYTLVGINPRALPIEFSSIRISGSKIPIGYVLTYYYGFKGLLKQVGAKYRSGVKRELDIQDDEYSIDFKDTTFVFKLDDVKSSLLLGRFVTDAKILRTIESRELETKDGIVDFLYEFGYDRKAIIEFGDLESLFIDPITEEVLKHMKEPTLFPKLLLRASELLVTDYHDSVNNMKGIMYRGYERINGMIYNTLAKSLKQYRRNMGYGRSTVNVDPYAVIRILNEDSALVLEEDLNPIGNLKQFEDTTLTGFLGRSKDAINLYAREIDPSQIGFISEASKESGDVGVTAYMTANPKLDNLLGIVEDTGELTASNRYSTSVMLAPFGTHDDPKRMLFNSVQNSHLIPMDGQQILPIRTGYETVLAQRVSDKFASKAKGPGVVTEVSKNKVVVKYQDGEETYSLKTWFTRDEAGSSYKHEMRSNVVEKQRVEKNHVITYDNGFFGPDIFDKRNVVYKAGKLARVGLSETFDNFEDSNIFHTEFTKESSATFVRVKSIVIDTVDELVQYARVGDVVDFDTPLITTRGADAVENDDYTLTNEAIEILKELTATSPKAKVKGKISHLEVKYNLDPKDAPKNVQEIITYGDKLLKQTGSKYTGKVTSSYSVATEPLMEGELEIKFFIEYTSNMTIGDKGVIQNQLKFTIGNTKDVIQTLDGERVDMLFSSKSIDARVVESANLAGTTNTLLVEITKNVIDQYFE